MRNLLKILSEGEHKVAGTKAASGAQEESTGGSDLRQGGRVEDVPADGITKGQKLMTS